MPVDDVDAEVSLASRVAADLAPLSAHTMRRSHAEIAVGGDGSEPVTLTLDRGHQLVEFVVGESRRVDVEERIDHSRQVVDPLRHEDRIAHQYD